MRVWELTQDRLDEMIKDNNTLYHAGMSLKNENSNLKTEIKYLNDQVAGLKAQKGIEMNTYYIFGAALLAVFVIGWYIGKIQGWKNAVKDTVSKEATERIQKAFEGMMRGVK